MAVPIPLRTWGTSMKYVICAVCENVECGEYGRRKPNPNSAPFDPLAATGRVSLCLPKQRSHGLLGDRFLRIRGEAACDVPVEDS